MATASEPVTLRANTVGTFGLLFQAMGQEAPIAIFAGSITGAAAYALGATPLAFILGMLASLLAANTIYQYAKKVANAGGYYAYVADGMGSYSAAFTAYMYIIYQVLNIAFIILIYLWTFSLSINVILSTNLPGWAGIPFVALESLAVFITVYLGLRPSVRVLTVFGLVESAVVIAFSTVIIAHAPVNSLAPFTFTVPPGAGGVFLGFVTGSYFAYAGYGSIVPLGEEARAPKKTIGKAVVILLLIIGAIYIYAAYAQVVGWGIPNMASFAGSGLPGAFLAQQDIGLWAAALVIILYNLVMFTPLVAMATGLSRTAYAMGRDGLLPKAFAHLHPRHRTPTTALWIFALAASVLAILVATVFDLLYGFVNGVFDAWLILLTASTLATLTIHILANTALTASLRKTGVRASAIFTHVVVPLLSSAVIFAVIYYAVQSGIAYPILLGPLGFVGVSLAIILIIAARRKVVRNLRLAPGLRETPLPASEP